jgi:hypothetical protein
MNNRLFFALSIILLQVLGSSCDNENDAAPAPLEEAIPLEVGNEWVYEVTDYDTKGKSLTTAPYRRSVLKDTTIENSTWYVLSDGSIVQNSRDGYVYYNTADNEHVMIYQGPDYGGIGYMYKYPDFDLWVLTTRSQQKDTIRTAAEVYESYRFKIEKQHKSPNDSTPHILNQYDYVAPGVGLVRSDIYYVDSDNVRQRHELVRYTLR